MSRGSWKIHTYDELIEMIDNDRDTALVLQLLIEKLMEKLPEESGKDVENNPPQQGDIDKSNA